MNVFISVKIPDNEVGDAESQPKKSKLDTNTGLFYMFICLFLSIYINKENV